MKNFIKKTYKEYVNWASSDNQFQPILYFVFEKFEFLKLQTFPTLNEEIDKEKYNCIKTKCIKRQLIRDLKFMEELYTENNFTFIYERIQKLKQRLENFNLQTEESEYASDIILLLFDFYKATSNPIWLERFTLFAKNVQNIQKFIFCWDYYYDLRIDEPIVTDVEAAVFVYNDLNIDIKKDKCFSKFGLIEASDFYSFPPRVYDSRVDKTFFIKYNDNELFSYLAKIKPFLSTNIQIQIIPEKYFNGKFDKRILKEDIEIGHYLDLSRLFTPEVSQLVNWEKDNKLRITINQNGIMFEEMASDFETQGQVIITRVLHASYFEEESHFYIDHLDCEFARYENLESYIEAREISEDVRRGLTKGIGKTVKIFKIDNAKIPFKFESGEYILLDLLNIFFKNLDLVREYFQNITSIDKDNN